jgi:hypothetical protein
MTRHGWSAEHRDALLSRVTLLTASTAVVGAVGAVALGAGLAAATPVASKAPAPAPSTKPAAKSATKPSATASSGSDVAGVGGSGQSNAALAPQDIEVAVLNGTGVEGAAHAAAGDLRKSGFRISATGNYQGRVSQSIIGYPAGMKASAQLLADATGVSQIQQADTGGQIVLVVGADWQGSKPVVQAPPPDQSGNGGGNGGGNGPVSSGGS